MTISSFVGERIGLTARIVGPAGRVFGMRRKEQQAPVVLVGAIAKIGLDPGVGRIEEQKVLVIAFRGAVIDDIAREDPFASGTPARPGSGENA
jgi:hypothetical protein